MKFINVLMAGRRAGRTERARAEGARVMRDLGYTHYGIAQALGMSLSEVRRALDPRAAKLHRLWRR